MKQIRVFRIVGDVRRPYIIELDSESTVLAEYADTTANAAREAPRAVTGTALAKLEPAKIVARAAAKWAIAEIEDNPIPGSDDLRAEYFQAKAALQEKYIAQGSTCPGCELGKLMRQFKEKLKLAGHLSQFE
jgi:hypothetical protein